MINDVLRVLVFSSTGETNNIASLKQCRSSIKTVLAKDSR